jgi:alkanesulfonate monooxygenase SsuD/methylene tetrahydromethanopterin reductase-like flavin-dependent oxidoreductase (luciferase family)
VPVRFGFKTSPQDTTWDAMLEVWRAADDMGVFESGWTSDHFYPMHGADPSRPRLEGWVTLAALAQATRRLRPGTLVTGIDYRHPAVLANMAATLDIISAGRLELGIGTGWNKQEAMEHDSPKLLFRQSCEYLASSRVVQPGAVSICGDRAGPVSTPR